LSYYDPYEIRPQLPPEEPPPSIGRGIIGFALFLVCAWLLACIAELLGRWLGWYA
jgi:hypothetical protein